MTYKECENYLMIFIIIYYKHDFNDTFFSLLLFLTFTPNAIMHF